MSNDVQSHEEVAEGVSAEDRRGSSRHAARALGSVTARIIGGSQVDLVNFSSRGVLFECDSRLLIGARASVRITTLDANLIVTGRVVRSRVKGLVNGALRYDAALVLDKDLALTPAILAAVPTAADDLVSFESDFEDPSPVEAYLAESEASLLEVASGSDLTLHGSVVDAALEMAVELPPVDVIPAVDEPAELAATDEPIVLESDSAVVDADPVAFDDGEIAFEPSVEFAFDELEEGAFDEPAETPFDDHAGASPEASVGVLVVEPVVVDEPAGSSMFDATYIPPVYETQASEPSVFEVTPPMAAPSLSASSFFDARPSEHYGDAPEPPAAGAALVQEADVETAEPSELAVGVTDGIDFESEVAFEAEDAVMFEAAFEDAAAEQVVAELLADPVAELLADPVGELLIDPVAEQLIDPAAELLVDPVAEPLVDLVAEAAAFADPLPTLDAVDAPVIEVVSDDNETLAAVPVTDDRVLLQFAATVPHDLAELRRIAADNQW